MPSFRESLNEPASLIVKFSIHERLIPFYKLFVGSFCVSPENIPEHAMGPKKSRQPSGSQTDKSEGQARWEPRIISTSLRLPLL